jgi:hypothetical protein
MIGWIGGGLTITDITVSLLRNLGYSTPLNNLLVYSALDDNQNNNNQNLIRCACSECHMMHNIPVLKMIYDPITKTATEVKDE